MACGGYSGLFYRRGFGSFRAIPIAGNVFIVRLHNAICDRHFVANSVCTKLCLTKLETNLITHTRLNRLPDMRTSVARWMASKRSHRTYSQYTSLLTTAPSTQLQVLVRVRMTPARGRPKYYTWTALSQPRLVFD